MITLYIVTAYGQYGYCDWAFRAYKTQTRAEKRFKELTDEYKLRAVMELYQDGKRTVIKKGEPN